MIAAAGVLGSDVTVAIAFSAASAVVVAITTVLVALVVDVIDEGAHGAPSRSVMSASDTSTPARASGRLRAAGPRRA